MGAYTLVSPCYSSDGSNPSAGGVAGAQVPCDGSQPDCVDNNGVPCSSNGQPLSVIQAEGYPVTSPSSPSSSVGAQSAASSGGSGSSISSSSLGLFSSLAADAAQAYSAVATPAKPATGITVGSSGLSLTGNSSLLLLGLGAAIIAFLVWGGKKKALA